MHSSVQPLVEGCLFFDMEQTKPGLESIRTHIMAVPELAEWPELASVTDRAGRAERPDWKLPLLACRAVGGDESQAVIAAASIACLQISIILIDDMLDHDPRGEHLNRGHGPTANLAGAFQATAFRLVDQLYLNAETRSALLSCLAHIALATAVGQQLDIQNLEGESNYWKTVMAKSTPFYGGALQVGGIVGGADPNTVAQLYELGLIMGESIQLEDDLDDSLQVPANADWIQGRSNLLILYARQADHPARERFERLLPRSGEPEVLSELQRILLESGALSFVAYHLIDRYQKMGSLVSRLDLVNPSPIVDLLHDYAVTLVRLLRVGGIEIREEELLDNSAFSG